MCVGLLPLYSSLNTCEMVHRDPGGPRASALWALMSGLELGGTGTTGTTGTAGITDVDLWACHFSYWKDWNTGMHTNLEASPAPIQGGYQMALTAGLMVLWCKTT